MKRKNIYISLIILAAIGSQACDQLDQRIEGTGPIQSQTLELDEFSSILMEGSDEVYISYGESQEVVVKGNANIISRVRTEVRDGEWNLSLERGSYGHYELSYHITLPALDGIRNVGSGNARVSGDFSEEKVTLDILGSGSIHAFDLECQKARVDIIGSGNVELTVFERLDVDISGSGNVHYKGSPLVYDDISGSGRVHYVGQ